MPEIIYVQVGTPDMTCMGYEGEDLTLPHPDPTYPLLGTSRRKPSIPFVFCQRHPTPMLCYERNRLAVVPLACISEWEPDLINLFKVWGVCAAE